MSDTATSATPAAEAEALRLELRDAVRESARLLAMLREQDARARRDAAALAAASDKDREIEALRVRMTELTRERDMLAHALAQAKKGAR